jgi:adenylate cyclase
LVAEGIPIWRASLDLPTIDLNSRALMHKWWRDGPVTVEALPHGPEQEAVFQRSAIAHLISRGLEIHRWRLERDESSGPFRRRAAPTTSCGWSDLGDATSATRGVAFSMAADRAGGFSDAEITLVSHLVPALGLAAYRVSAAQTASNVLSVYLGPHTARRVLAGEIRRGGREDGGGQGAAMGAPTRWST